jgi:hypothetical protein
MNITRVHLMGMRVTGITAEIINSRSYLSRSVPGAHRVGRSRPEYVCSRLSALQPNSSRPHQLAIFRYTAGTVWLKDESMLGGLWQMVFLKDIPLTGKIDVFSLRSRPAYYTSIG